MEILLSVNLSIFIKNSWPFRKEFGIYFQSRYNLFLGNSGASAIRCSFLQRKGLNWITFRTGNIKNCKLKNTFKNPELVKMYNCATFKKNHLQIALILFLNINPFLIEINIVKKASPSPNLKCKYVYLLFSSILLQKKYNDI